MLQYISKVLTATLLISLIGCTTTSTTDTSKKEVRGPYNNVIFEPEIKTLRLYPNANNAYEEILPPVVQMGKNRLILEFDDLVEEYENYYARLIHCNADWSKSRLSPLQYLDDFNEFPINSYEYSSGTRISYVHYRFSVPQVKLPGNYILEVYRNTSDNVVFRQRIMYFQPYVDVDLGDQSANFNVGRINQRINFTIDYSDYNIINPMNRVSVVIRQNERWDNSIFNLKPSFINELEKELRYQYFDEENVFSGGNEYRAFDIRSVESGGANIKRIEKGDTVMAVLATDIMRDYQSYALDRDLNGKYVIMNYDLGNDDYEADYLNVIFTLKTSRKFLGDIFIHGGLTNWKTTSENRMKYYPSIPGYQKNLILKQGWYNYEYLLKGDTLSTDFIEGQHFETENAYEIFVYYNTLDLNADLLIGYARWTVNEQF